MKEKLLIESEKTSLDKYFLKKFVAIPYGVIYVVILIYGICVSFLDGIPVEPVFLLQVLLVAALFYSPVFVVALFIWYISKNQIVVTDKRISGKSAFGKQVDLPIDSVSAVFSIRLIKGLSISTASGKVSFWAIRNRDDIYKVISELIIARQNKTIETVSATQGSGDYTEELKKIKALLDCGVITQEEFEAKKKQLLGL